MSKGIDYAFSPHPSIAALKSAGVTFVCRYISSFAPNDSNGKNLSAAEARALHAAGIALVVVVEEGASRMLAGHSAGVSDAQHADAVVKAVGLAGIPVYFACDFDAAEGQQPAINAYLDGAASIIGKQRTGVYGGYYVVKRALDGKHAAYAWQTRAWSGGQWDTRAQLRQGATVSLGGASVDADVSMTADYGQWPRPKVAAPPAQKPAKPVADPPTVPVGPTPPAAPKGLTASAVTLTIAWRPVSVDGKPAAGYTVKAVGQNGKVYASLTAATTSAELTGLHHGWTYDVVVSADGGKVVSDAATLKVTV